MRVIDSLLFTAALHRNVEFLGLILSEKFCLDAYKVLQVLQKIRQVVLELDAVLSGGENTALIGYREYYSRHILPLLENYVTSNGQVDIEEARPEGIERSLSIGFIDGICILLKTAFNS